MTKDDLNRALERGEKMANCPICNGQKENAKITFSVDLGDTIVVVRNTPAMVCYCRCDPCQSLSDT